MASQSMVNQLRTGIICSLGFFVGVSWVNTAGGSTIDDVLIINDWGGKAKTADYNFKVPSLIAYRDENATTGMKEDKWGFGVESNMVSWSWMKLLLDKGQAKTYYDDTFFEVREHPHMAPETIVSDQISLIPEPEAAAVAVLKELARSAIVEPGDGVLICDCGGGTVDITTYEVIQSQPTLKFEELLVGAGGKCGAASIDQRFLKWMSNEFGSAFNNLHAKLKGPGSKLMKDFESAKRDFKPNCGDSYEVTLFMRDAENSAIYDVAENTVRIEWSTMKSFFQPAVGKIIDLVWTQVKQAKETGVQISKVVLVGGFGDSEYLFAELKAAFASIPQMNVICPKHPQAAIVKGAALRGLENLKSQRKRCRRHYGFGLNEVFREGVDPEKDAWYCPSSGRKYCANRIYWAMSKGQYVDEKTFFSKNLIEWITEKEVKNPTKIVLLCSTFEEQAERTYDLGVYTVGEITACFTALDLSTFESKHRNRKKRFKLEYDIQVLPFTTDGILQFKVVAQGKEIGSAQIEYGRG